MKSLERVHFVGIGGYGMSAIAKIMLELGYRVSGSDVLEQDLTIKLRNKGADIFIGHDARHVHGADLVVYSTALPRDNVEIEEAKRLQIPVIHRSEMLARLLNSRKGIAVAGTHGKTTTSSMIAYGMMEGGKDPTFIIGGEMMNAGTNAKAGKGEYIVAEADESDGSFLQYTPSIAVITNVEPDHLENYEGDFNRLKEAYFRFLNRIKPDGLAIVCFDDPVLREMAMGLNTKMITYAVDREADYRATDIRLGDRGVIFDVWERDGKLGTVELSVPGKHNVYNAMAAMIVCKSAGIPFETFRRTIKDFTGAKRRFQVLGEVNDILIVDDYAHHPTEIRATLGAAKATGKKVIAVFQPHRYSRTFFLFEEFSRAFSDADEVIVPDIYSPAGEKRIEGVSSEKLADLIRKNSNANVRYIPRLEDVQQYLLERVKPGDLVLTMGAGDIWKVSHGLCEPLRRKFS